MDFPKEHSGSHPDIISEYDEPWNDAENSVPFIGFKGKFYPGQGEIDHASIPGFPWEEFYNEEGENENEEETTFGRYYPYPHHKILFYNNPIEPHVTQAMDYFSGFSKEHSGSHQKNSMQHVFLSPDHPAYINEAEYAHPFLYLNGSLFVGNKGEHHSNVITRHELNKWPHPWSDENTDGRAIPEEGIYWTGLHGDSPGLADALDQHFSLSGSHLGASNYNVQKYVWFDGKMIVTPPQYMHDEPYHATLAQDVGYRWDDPNATIEFGYYFPDDDSLQAYHEKGQGLPAEQELKEFIRAHPKGNLETVFPKEHQASIEPEHLPEDATYPVDNLILQHADPIAGQAGEWENQRVPFLYLPDKQYLYYGNAGDHHFGLVQKAYTDHPDIWDTPHISGFLKQDGTHKIFNSMVWPNAIRPHMELLKQQLSDESVHSARAKQAVALFPFHKYVWADGKIAVGPRVETDSVRPWHTDLMSSMGYNYQTNMPEEWNVGYYYPHDHSTYEIDSTENVPDEYSIVKQIHNHLEDGDVHAPRSSGRAVYHEYECQAANYFFDTM